ncbi:MAG: DUF5020 family protein [Bacteroidales bacterium]|nr:DUF5020 family protein [Bacteroidales bacterium]
MRILLLTILLATLSQIANAQNLQLHYDFGDDRQMLTSTAELFKPDSCGSTFFFIDFDYGSKASDVEGISLGYWEIARELKFWEAPISINLEYNGGFGQFKATPFNGAYSINNAYLVGPSYSWNNANFSKGFTIKALYKYIKDKHDAAFQITGVWYMHFFSGKVTFSGFADFWREDNTFATKETSYVFLTEPQLWYNATKKLSVGGEIEISSNFGGNEGFMVNPTIGLKWTL